MGMDEPSAASSAKLPLVDFGSADADASRAADLTPSTAADFDEHSEDRCSRDVSRWSEEFGGSCTEVGDAETPQSGSPATPPSAMTFRSTQPATASPAGPAVPPGARFERAFLRGCALNGELGTVEDPSGATEGAYSECGEEEGEHWSMYEDIDIEEPVARETLLCRCYRRHECLVNSFPTLPPTLLLHLTIALPFLLDADTFADGNPDAYVWLIASNFAALIAGLGLRWILGAQRHNANETGLCTWVSISMGCLWLKVLTSTVGMELNFMGIPRWDALEPIRMILDRVWVFSFLKAMRLRLEIIERQFGQGLVIEDPLATVHRATTVVSVVTFFMWNKDATHHDWVNSCVLMQMRGMMQFRVVIVFWRVSRQVSQATELPESMRSGYLAAEARWARKVMDKFRWGICTSSLINSMVFLTLGQLFTYLSICRMFFDEMDEVLTMVVNVCECFTFLIEVVALMLSVGMFQPMRPAIELDNMPSPSFQETDVSSASKGVVWHQTVERLAGRSVRIIDILVFYELLGRWSRRTKHSQAFGDAAWATRLPHFAHFLPRNSLTVDVVRQAIIPMTRDAHGGGSAFATMLDGDTPHEPSVMVTHAWGQPFVNLVAACLANALSETEYYRIKILLLKRDFRAIEAELLRAHVEQRRYWICCFCVNQHASICGSWGPEPAWDSARWYDWDRLRRDSVSQRCFQACDCKQPKLWNDNPACELDKFDSMMRLLHGRVPFFSEMIVIDEGAKILTRIWCVAEMVEAYFSRIPQTVMMPCSKLINPSATRSACLKTYEQIVMFKVENCEASRAEDKDSILAKIPDVAFFNNTVQGLIFAEHGILKNTFVGFGNIEAATMVARRVKAVVDGRTYNQG